MLTIKIKPRSGKRAKSGHPWIFSNEIVHPSPKPEAGVLAAVEFDDGVFAGYAAYNPHSLIGLRLLSRNHHDVPGSLEWFSHRFEKAAAFRKRIYPERKSYRLIYSDSDDLSGLIVDLYEDVLCVQILSAGMERLIAPISQALQKVLQPSAIVLRNDSPRRELEGLARYTKVIAGNLPDEIIIDENGIKLAVDLLAGQKTGHFFDQADNRLALSALAKDAEVLDLFSHTGAWGIKMLQAGAQKAFLLDLSDAAMKLAQRNAQLNDVDSRIEWIRSEAFEWLSSARRQGREYDIVIVDPPAFAKNTKQTKKALRGYEDLNRQAIRLVRNGGMLCSCSCSYYVSEEQFLQTIQRAASREKKMVKILQIRSQAQDHPILLSMPESRYLKCIIGRIESI